MTVKSFEEILVRMVAYFKAFCSKVTDFSIGSTIRTIFESVAIEIEELYFALRDAVEEAIRESTYQTFGFERREATAAYAYLTFSFLPHPNTEITIPAGFEVSTANQITFRTVDTVTVAPEETEKDVLAVCTTPGIGGNVPPNSIVYPSSFLPYFLSVSNKEAAFGGTLAETDAERRRRFTMYLKSLGKGTKTALLYALSTIPNISYANLDEPYPGIVEVYISTPSGDVDEETLRIVSETLEEWKAAGVQVLVFPVVKLSLDVSVTAFLTNTTEYEYYRTLLTDATVNYLNTRNVGEDFVPSNLVSVLMGIDPNVIHDVSIIPQSRVRVLKNQVIRAGTVTVVVEPYAEQ